MVLNFPWSSMFSQAKVLTYLTLMCLFLPTYYLIDVSPSSFTVISLFSFQGSSLFLRQLCYINRILGTCQPVFKKFLRRLRFFSETFTEQALRVILTWAFSTLLWKGTYIMKKTTGKISAVIDIILCILCLLYSVVVLSANSGTFSFIIWIAGGAYFFYVLFFSIQNCMPNYQSLSK